MWVSKAKQKKKEKRGLQSRELSLFHFFKPSPGAAAGPVMQETPAGRVSPFEKKKKKKVTYGKLSVQARGGPNHPSRAAFLMSHCLSLGQGV